LTQSPVRGRLAGRDSVLVIVSALNGKRSQPDLPDNVHFAADLDRGAVAVHLSQYLRADRTLVNHRGINTGNVANTYVVHIIVGFGVVIPRAQSFAGSWGQGCVGRTYLQEVFDHWVMLLWTLCFVFCVLGNRKYFVRILTFSTKKRPRGSPCLTSTWSLRFDLTSFPVEVRKGLI